MSETNLKFSPQTNMYLMGLPAGSNPTVEATLRLTSPANSQDRLALSEAGAQVQSVVGTVVTIQAPARSLDRIADLDCVTHIEVATPMFPEQ